jgi:hypothetical protein
LLISFIEKYSIISFEWTDDSNVDYLKNVNIMIKTKYYESKKLEIN